MKADSNIARPRSERVIAFALPQSTPTGAVVAAVEAPAEIKMAAPAVAAAAVDVIAVPSSQPTNRFATARPTESTFRNPCFCTPAEAYDEGHKRARSYIGRVVARTGRFGPLRGKLVPTRIVGQAEGYADWNVALAEAKRLARESGKSIFLAHYGIGGRHRVSYSGTWLLELEGSPIVRDKTRVTPPQEYCHYDIVNPAGHFFRH